MTDGGFLGIHDCMRWSLITPLSALVLFSGEPSHSAGEKESHLTGKGKAELDLAKRTGFRKMDEEEHVGGRCKLGIQGQDACDLGGGWSGPVTLASGPSGWR